MYLGEKIASYKILLASVDKATSVESVLYGKKSPN
jgi:hypothetical protein